MLRKSAIHFNMNNFSKMNNNQYFCKLFRRFSFRMTEVHVLKQKKPPEGGHMNNIGQ